MSKYNFRCGLVNKKAQLFMNLATDNLFRHSAKSIFLQISSKNRPLLAPNMHKHTHRQDNPNSSTSQPKQTDTSLEITCCLSAFLQMYFLKVRPQSHTDDEGKALWLILGFEHGRDQEHKLWVMAWCSVWNIYPGASKGTNNASKQGWKKLSESTFGRVKQNVGAITRDSKKKNTFRWRNI